jgi:altronate dehydratase
MAAARLEGGALAGTGAVRRFVALPHTEGCGGTSDGLLLDALVGYLRHPSVRAAVVVEHGCEKIHNDCLRDRLAAAGLEPSRYGWASVQLDGGNQQVIARIAALFAAGLAGAAGAAAAPPTECEVGLEAVRLGVLWTGAAPAPATAAAAQIVRWVASAGGTVLVHAEDGLGELLDAARLDDAAAASLRATLPWAQRPPAPGVYVADMPTDHWAEQVTGMAASGVDAVLGYADEHPLQGHPLVPLVQASATPAVLAHHAADLDVALAGQPEGWSDQLLKALAAVLSRQRLCRAVERGNTEVQVTRGLLGVSL